MLVPGRTTNDGRRIFKIHSISYQCQGVCHPKPHFWPNFKVRKTPIFRPLFFGAMVGVGGRPPGPTGSPSPQLHNGDRRHAPGPLLSSHYTPQVDPFSTEVSCRLFGRIWLDPWGSVPRGFGGGFFTNFSKVALSCAARLGPLPVRTAPFCSPFDALSNAPGPVPTASACPPQIAENRRKSPWVLPETESGILPEFFPLGRIGQKSCRGR